MVDRRTVSRTLAAIAVAVSLGACSPTSEVRGYVPDEERLGSIEPGVHDRRAVAEVLGSPSSVATFEHKTWYYITRHTEQLAFFDAKVTDQQVVAVHFNDDGLVEDVRRYTMEDGKIIDPVDRRTPTRGKELTLLQQLFGNLGRFVGEDSDTLP